MLRTEVKNILQLLLLHVFLTFSKPCYQLPVVRHLHIIRYTSENTHQYFVCSLFIYVFEYTIEQFSCNND